MIGASPAAVVIIAGVNDVYQGRAVEHVMAQLRTMYDRAAHAGIRVVAGTIVPYNTATPDQNERMHQINAWIRQQDAQRAGGRVRRHPRGRRRIRESRQAG